MLGDDSDEESLGEGGFDLSKGTTFDDADDFEEEEEPSSKRKRKGNGKRSRKKHRAFGGLIDDEAESDDSGNESEDVDDPREDEWDRQYAETIKRQDEERKRRELAGGMFGGRAANEQDTVARIQRRHEEEKRRQAEYESHGGAPNEVVRLQPTIHDQVFMIKCDPGKETELCLALMNKMRHLASKGKPSSVLSVSSNGSKGCIYIECDNEGAVTQLITGMRKLKAWSMSLVPVNDLSSAMTAKSGRTRRGVKLNSWVRMKRKGDYQGDLARVVDITRGGTHAIVQLEPRVDYALIGLSSAEIKSRQRQRPPQKLFDPEAAREHGGDVTRGMFPNHQHIPNWMDARSHFDVFEGNYYLDGYLFKEVAIESQLDTDRIIPTVAEAQRFQMTRGLEDDDERKEDSMNKVIREVAKSIAAASSDKISFVRGDTVQVTKGDNSGLIGSVLRIDTAQKTVTVNIADIAGQEIVANKQVEYSADELQKFIEEGAHVKVIDGIYAGETGFLNKVDFANGVAFVRTDLSPREIEVRISDLQESEEVATGLNSLQGLKLYDLVKLPEPNVSGVVVQVGREDLKVLDTHGSLRTIKPAQIQGVLNGQSNRERAFDVDSRDIVVGKTVTVIDGQYKKQDNTVKHIFKSYLFLHSRMRSANAGIIVVRAKMVRVAGLQGSSSKFSDNYMGVQHKDLRSAGRGRGAKTSIYQDALVGKSVRITRGKQKGLQGTVRSATETHVKIELDAKHRMETVKRDFVKEVSQVREGAPVGHDEVLAHMATPYLTATTPITAHTPLATPVHGTPMHDGGGTPMRDAVWMPGVGDTPRHEYTDPFDASSSVGPSPGGATPQYDYDEESGYSSNMQAHGSDSPASLLSGVSKYSTAASTPLGFDPSMPGADMPYQGTETANTVQLFSKWCGKQIECRVIATKAICKVLRLVSSNPIHVEVEFKEGGSQVFPMEELEPTIPEKDDTVVIHSLGSKDDQNLEGETGRLSVHDEYAGCVVCMAHSQFTQLTTFDIHNTAKVADW